MERIGFGARFGAALIDVVILIITMSIVGVVFGAGAFAMASAGQMTGFSIGTLIVMLIPLAYTSTEILMAGTPGKKVLKLAIRNEDGSVADQETLAKRWAFKSSASILQFLAALTTMSIFTTVGSVAGLIVMVGCFFVFGASRQAFHDKFAKTAVYKV